MKYANSLLDLVGNTPLVKLHSTVGGATPLVLAKVEYLNPGGSVKDRIAVRMDGTFSLWKVSTPPGFSDPVRGFEAVEQGEDVADHQRVRGLSAESREAGETVAQQIRRDDAEMRRERIDVAGPGIGRDAEAVQQHERARLE